MTELYTYAQDFHTMAAVGSAYSAGRVTRLMRSILPIGSVADIGCARGTWLNAWRACGVADIMGADGEYTDLSALEIPRESFAIRDLNRSIALGRRFDLAQCLEVAEHLPPSRAAGFVAELCALAPAVMFSAAQPGQGGEHHINEQPLSYWQALFAAEGYVTIDCLRPALALDPRIAPWYRYNLLLFVQRDGLDAVSPFARAFTLGDGVAAADVSPLPYRLRKAVIRMLPEPVCDALARWNARRIAAAG